MRFLKKIIFEIQVAKNVGEFCWNVECRAVQKCVDLVDLVKSFLTSLQYLLAKIGFDTVENGPLKVCQKISLKLEKQLEET